MSDRGMIKWLPFDSVTSSKKMVHSIMKEKNKITKPVLSEEQIKEIERGILEGFHNQNILRIVYFYRGSYQIKQGLILDLQENQKKIILEDHSSLYFDQIVQVINL